MFNVVQFDHRMVSNCVIGRGGGGHKEKSEAHNKYAAGVRSVQRAEEIWADCI